AEQYLEKAVGLLESLVQMHPTVPAYRHLLALGYREKASRPWGPFAKTADKDRQEAITLLKKLATDFPSVPDYRFELSETLLTGRSPPHVTRKDVEEALRLATDLVGEHPNVADYQISKAHIHMRLALIYRDDKKLDKAETEKRS